MATIRRFCCNDLLGFASVNLDHLTVTAKLSVYLTWFATWSDYCNVAVAPGNLIIGYILGGPEEESEGEHWQGLVVAVNVASDYRRQGLARRLMRLLEKLLVEKMLLSPRDLEYYVCLYVGIHNEPAIELFEQHGYEFNEIMPDFMPDNEEAFYMRKKLTEEGEVFQF